MLIDSVNRTEEIVLCELCKGTGQVEREELIDHHNNKYKRWKEKCPDCEGYGRLKKIAYVEYKQLTEEDSHPIWKCTIRSQQKC